MLKIITLAIILTGCQTALEIRVKQCPRTLFYNHSNLPFNKTDLYHLNTAASRCKDKNPELPCAVWGTKRGKINYYIQCAVMPRYDGTGPILIKRKAK